MNTLKNRKLKIYIIFIASIVVLLSIKFVLASECLSVEICNDGIDNDCDGLYDSLKNIDPNNGQTWSLVGDPFAIRTFVNDRRNLFGYIKIPDQFNGAGTVNKDATSAQEVCKIAGFSTVVSFDCYSPVYEGRCGWSSPGDNVNALWNTGRNDWDLINSRTAGNKWLATIYCKNKLSQCSDGIDNDNDGKIDMNDPGCDNPNDDDERPHDTNCVNNCNSNADCNDNNPNTDDVCQNPGTSLSYCTNNPIAITCFKNSDCGINGFIGEKLCKEGNVYQNYREFTCINPGTITSVCSSSLVQKVVENCQLGCNNDACINAICNLDSDCNDNNPKTEDKCINPGTSQSKCEHYNISCSSNTDCGADGFIENPFCQNNNVFQNFKSFKCNNPGTKDSFCASDICAKLKQTCPNFCSYGECKNYGCTKDSDCGYTGTIGENFCSYGDVFKRFQNSTCINPNTQNSYCSTIFGQKLITDCLFGCVNNQCVESETNPPIITLIAPLNNSSLSNPISFVYTASDNSGVSKCSLIVDEEVIQSSASINQGNNTFTDSIYSGNHSWFITCTDIFNNTGNSVTRVLHVTSECSCDSDCGESDTVTVCKDDNVAEKITTSKCINNTCKSTISYETIKECKYGCKNAKCIAKETDNNHRNLREDSIEEPLDSDLILNKPLVRGGSYPPLNVTSEKKQVLTSKTSAQNYLWLLLLLLMLILILILLIIIVLASRVNNRVKKK